MFNSGSTVWHYLFAIFNGTNGLILFLIYFYGRALAFYRIHKGTSSMNTMTTNVDNTTPAADENPERKPSDVSQGSFKSEDSFE